MPPLTDATTALLRALRRRFGEAAEAHFEEVVSREWASATFTGARHKLVIRIDGAEAGTDSEAFLSDLDVAEVTMRGHILADIALLWDERRELDGGLVQVRIALEALTVEAD